MSSCVLIWFSLIDLGDHCFSEGTYETDNLAKTLIGRLRSISSHDLFLLSHHHLSQLLL